MAMAYDITQKYSIKNSRNHHNLGFNYRNGFKALSFEEVCWKDFKKLKLLLNLATNLLYIKAYLAD